MGVTLALHRRSARAQGVVEWAGALFLGVLLVMLGLHALATTLDIFASVRYPYELDYGEGIVWYQATRIPGADMYRSTGPAGPLPFIVFHYPPVYYMVVRAVAPLMPDVLSAGRLVSGLATLAIVPCVAGLVVTAGRRYGERLMARHLAIAAVAGLLVLAIHAVRTWGLFMRVDMVGVVLSLAGLLVAARANGRIPGTTLGLLLCVAAVFTKQTELPSVLAVGIVTLLRKPRKGLIASGIAGGVALLALGALQIVTEGGFLHNIIGNNLNRYSLGNVYWSLRPEQGSTLFIALFVVAAVVLLIGLWRERAPGPRIPALRQLLLIIRLLDPTMAARALLLLHFGLSTLMLATLLKTGGSFNYLIGWLCAGAVLYGVMLCDLLANRGRFVLMLLILAFGVAIQPYRQMPDRASQADLDRQTELVRLVAAAQKPVASEEMTLLMRAGKPVMFEPSIVTELAAVGRWDETPLVDMVRNRGFAFMITTSNRVGGTDRRSPAVDAAMRVAYPLVERVGPGLFLNLPRD